MAGPKNRKGGKKGSKDTEVPPAPEGKEKFLDRLGRYSLYGQMMGNDNANMTMGQRAGGAMFSALQDATLGQMGALGKAMSAGLSARGKKVGGTAGGSGIDTQTIPFQQIKSDDVVSAINQSTRQVVGGLNTLNNTFGKGFNGLTDQIQAQSQALDSIVGANEDVAIQMREIYELLNRLTFMRDNNGGAGKGSNLLDSQSLGGSQSGGGGGLLGALLSGAALSLLDSAIEKRLGSGDSDKDKAPPDSKKPPKKSSGILKNMFDNVKGAGLSKIGGGIAGILGSLALDYGSEYATEAGYEKSGAGLGILSDVLSGAGTGALIGGGAGLIGGPLAGITSGIGAAVGGVAGLGYGLYDKGGTLFGLNSEADASQVSSPPPVSPQTGAGAAGMSFAPSIPQQGTLGGENSLGGTRYYREGEELSTGEAIKVIHAWQAIGGRWADRNEILAYAERIFPGRKYSALIRAMDALEKQMDIGPQSSISSTRSTATNIASADDSWWNFFPNLFGEEEPTGKLFYDRVPQDPNYTQPLPEATGESGITPPPPPPAAPAAPVQRDPDVSKKAQEIVKRFKEKKAKQMEPYLQFQRLMSEPQEIEEPTMPSGAYLAHRQANIDAERQANDKKQPVHWAAERLGGLLGSGRPEYPFSNQGTSEEKLKAQESKAEAEARANITNDIKINGRDLFYTANKITFDTETLEFKFKEKKETAAGTGAPAPVDTAETSLGGEYKLGFDTGLGASAVSAPTATPGGGASNWGAVGGTESRDGSGVMPQQGSASSDGTASEQAPPGKFRPVYKGINADLQDQDLINIIGNEARQSNESIDAVINNMMNRLGSPSYGNAKSLSAVAKQKNQYESWDFLKSGRFKPVSKERAEKIRQRMRLIASGAVPDSTGGANEFRASSYVFGKGRGKTFARTAAAQGNKDLGGNIYANTGFTAGPYAAYESTGQAPPQQSGAETATASSSAPSTGLPSGASIVPTSAPAPALSSGDEGSGASSTGIGSSSTSPSAPPEKSSSGGGSDLNAFLDSSKRGTDHASGLKGDFASKLSPFLQAAKSAGVDLKIGSGYRSIERQKQLFDAAVKKYGSVAAARKWVAPPGKSNHNGGKAVDLWSGGKAISRNSKAGQWAHTNAGKYGLYFRMGHEPWHIEPSKGGAVASTDDASKVSSSVASMGSESAATSSGGEATMADSSSGASSAGGLGGSGMSGASLADAGGMMGAGGGNPLAGMLGGGGSPFGVVGNMMGSLLGGLSSRTSMAAAAPKGGPTTTNIVNNNQKSGTHSAGGFPNANKPLPAIDNMFARLFDGSAMFG